jgi:hypothetical protein
MANLQDLLQRLLELTYPRFATSSEEEEEEGATTPSPSP